MTQNTADIVDALNALELGLRELGLWSDARPKAEHLASTMPFCYDTLELEQWLQFIFWVVCGKYLSRAMRCLSLARSILTSRYYRVLEKLFTRD